MISDSLNILKSGFKRSLYSYKLRPVDVILFLTYRCTSRCKTCNIWKWPKDGGKELSWDDWLPIFQNLKKDGVKTIELFGGDALLRKDLLINMIKFCNENDIETFFPTNANLLNEKIISELIESGLNTIYFSLDEIPSMKGSIRGVKDHFNKVTESISHAVKHRKNSNQLEIVSITTISKFNHHYIKELVAISNELGVDRHLLRGMSNFGNDVISNSKIDGILPKPYFMQTDDEDAFLNIDEAKKLLQSISDIKMMKKDHNATYVDITNLYGLKAESLLKWRYPKQKCTLCTTQLVITPSGDVLPCPFYNQYILGNLTDQGASKIWGNTKHRRFIDYQKNGIIDLCNFCSVKFYQKAFWASANDIVYKATGKIKKIFHS